MRRGKKKRGMKELRGKCVKGHARAVYRLGARVRERKRLQKGDFLKE